MPNLSLSTLATGARQFVVQLAFEMHLCSAVSLSSLTPRTQVRSGPLAGALITTFLRRRQSGCRSPALSAVMRPRNTPVLSSTTSTPSSPQGNVGRVALGHGLDLLAVDGQVLVVVGDRARVAAVNAVVLQQRGQRLVVGQVVDAHDLEHVGLGHQAAEHQPADTAESIDTDANCHDIPPLEHEQPRLKSGASLSADPGSTM